MALNVGELFATLKLDVDAFNRDLLRVRTAFSNMISDNQRAMATMIASANEVGDSLTRMGERGEDALERIRREANRTERSVDDVGNGGSNSFGKLTSASNVARFAIQGLAMAIGGLVIGMGAVTSAGVAMNASAEQSAIAFEGLLGSASRADKMIRDLTEFAKQTPFEYAGLEQASIKLINAGVSAGELQGVLTSLGDAISVSGGNIQEKLDGVTTAISQMLSKGKISSEEMNQLAERGIPAWDALSKQVGKSKAELMKLAEQGKLTAEFIPELITGLGAGSAGAMQMQSQTFTGLLGTLKDTAKIFLKDITKGAFKTLKGQLEDVVKSLEKMEGTFEKFYFVFTLNGILEEFVNILVDVAKWFGEAFSNIDSNVIYDFMASFSQLKESLKGLFTGDFVTGIAEIVMIVIQTAMDLLNALLPIVGFFVNILGKLLSANWFQGLLKIALSIWGVAKAIGLAVKWIIKPIQLFFAFMKQLKTDFSSSVWDVGGTKIEKFLNKLDDVLQNEFFVRNFPKLSAFIRKIIENISKVIGIFTGGTTESLFGIGATFDKIIMVFAGITATIQTLSLALYGNSDAWTLIGKAIQYAYYWILDLDNAFGTLVANFLPGGVLLQKTMQLFGFGAEDSKEKLSELEQEMADLYDSMNNRGEQYEAQQKALAQKDYDREQAFKRMVKEKENLIIQAKEGSAEAIEEVKQLAIDGSEMAIEAMAEMDEKFFLNLLDKKKALLESMISYVESVQKASSTIAILLDPNRFWGGMGDSKNNPMMAKPTMTPEQRKYYDERIEQLKQEVGLMDKLKSEYGLGIEVGGDGSTTVTGGGTSPEQSLFDKLKEDLEYRKSLNLVSLSQEMNAYQSWKKLFTKNTEDEIKIRREINTTLYQLTGEYLNQMDADGRAKIEKDKEYGKLSAEEAVKALEAHYALLIKERSKLEAKYGRASAEAIKTAREEAQKARLDVINEELKDAGQKRMEALEKVQQKEIDSLEKFYDDKIKAIEDGIQKEKDLYDKEDATEKKAELLKELRFLEGSYDKQALERAKEIAKELRQIERDATIKEMEENAEIKKTELENQKQKALEITENRHEAEKLAEENFWKERTAFYQQQALTIGKSIGGIADRITAESKKIRNAGKNFAQSLIDGFKSTIPTIKDEISKIVKMLDIDTLLGEFKGKTTNLFTNIDASKMTNPVGYYDERMGSKYATIQYNAPLLSVNNLTLGDKLDAKVLSTELFNASQNAIRSKGMRI